ncbi:MAG: WG repeat-containing protein [Lachnospiraceae bacterium]|nr:WG repeat-containing protein [Lachnospiraceae bacterium]
MKKKIVALLLAVCFCMSITGCGAESTSGEGGAKVENNGVGEEGNSEGAEASDGAVEEVKSPYYGNYRWAGTRILGDEMDYSQYEVDMVGNDGVITIKGYHCQDPFINGIAHVVALENNEFTHGVINTEGEVLVPTGKYDMLTRVGEDYAIIDQFIAKEISSQKYGVIDGAGKELVPCEYEEIQALGMAEDLYLYVCKQGTTYDIISSKGLVFFEALGTNSLTREVIYGEEPGKRLIRIMHSGETFCFHEDIEGQLPKPEDFASDLIYRGENIFSYTATDEQTKLVAYSEDGKSLIPLNISKGTTCRTVGENLMVHYVGTTVYDSTGKELYSSGAIAWPQMGYDDQVVYFPERSTQDGTFAILGENLEVIFDVPNCKSLKNAGGLVYAFPKDEATGTPDVYDFQGNLLYSNVTMLRCGDEYADFMREDGVFVHKSVGQPEAICAPEDELFVKSGDRGDWYCFVNGAGQYVYRDENLELLATFDAEVNYDAVVGVFYANDKYYNRKGELLYERQ